MKTPEELAYEFVKLAFTNKMDIRLDTAFIAGYNAAIASSHEQIKELQKRCDELQSEIALDLGFDHKLNESYIAAYGYKYCKHCGRRL